MLTYILFSLTDRGVCKGAASWPSRVCSRPACCLQQLSGRPCTPRTLLLEGHPDSPGSADGASQARQKRLKAAQHAAASSRQSVLQLPLVVEHGLGVRLHHVGAQEDACGVAL